ncbi:thiamine pyrophosphate-requiring protein [Halalkalicoccus sp. NIPERK01]|uniref:thiamine pyrophosphate-requiring protein n=1 Tax=Halalkalicoccus sp. NIPERK01 TaxID=3053469 RepID=UPI00256F634C|nr:thiamine pyrophosphate-requiring protein [Halalkalicoccus sp. NIPERK01]MDL5363330.1 thiamine pyrophosphate-requiring protein [Halalkalicoccus sp. NIPERK01]
MASPEVGERVIETLGDVGISYVFSTFGTDHPPLIKGLAKHDDPTLILAPHEMLAASAAHGYAQVTNEPQAVLVHVDVGTANLGASVHNAARSRVPMFILAGRTPVTTRNEQPGSRSIFVHYYQDVYDQHGLLREYAKWTYELETGANVGTVLARGHDLATAAPAGPVYLTLPREVLRQECETTGRSVPRRPDRVTATATTGAREELLALLRDASHPLVVTSYLGRDESAVGVLETFAETCGVGVVEAAPAFDLSFDREHPLHFGFVTEEHLDEADLLLVANCDVPWVPSRKTPAEGSTVVHIDPDPEKPQYPLWDFEVDHRLRAEPKAVFADLAAAFDETGVASERRDRLAEVGRRRREEVRSGVADPADADRITPGSLSAVLGEVLEDDDIVVDETVTNTVDVLRHLTRTEPGSYYSYCSSGLGWAGGASLGIKLARPASRVVSLVGDGSFVLGNPVAALQTAAAYDLPSLTVVYNNRRWRAVEDAIRDQYGEPGFDARSFTEYAPESNLARLAEVVGGYGERVDDPTELAGAIESGLAAVDDGDPAILDVRITE